MKLAPLALAAVAGLAFTAVAVAAPVSGSVVGPIVSVDGASFRLTTPLSPTGASNVSIGSATVLTEQVAASRSSIHAGDCVTALGTRTGSGVSAFRITISQPVEGKCTGGFGGRGGPGPRPGSGGLRGNGRLGGSGTPPQRPQGGAPGGFAAGNFGFASGGVTSVGGNTLTVQRKQSGKTTKSVVTITKQTSFTEIDRVGSGSVKTKLCAFVYGTSSDRGKTVQAQTISLSKPRANGCSGGFRRQGP